MKVIILDVVCSNCLQDRSCVGTGLMGGVQWLCQECVKRLEFFGKNDILIQAGWGPSTDITKPIFRVTVHCVKEKVYEVEADDEDGARENFYLYGDLVEEDDDYDSEIDSVELVLSKTKEKNHEPDLSQPPLC